MRESTRRATVVDPCWLVVCGTQDLAALWAFRGLSRRLPRVELITAEVLSCSRGWQHRIKSGAVSTSIELTDGRIFQSERLEGVLNRLTTVPAMAFRAAKTPDREYAAEEMLALWSSWLHSLPCPVLNRPSGQFPSPAWFHRSEWVWRAAGAGLHIAPYRESATNGSTDDTATDPNLHDPAARTIFVASDRVVPGVVPECVQEGARRLARDANVSLLALTFRVASDDSWGFLNAEAFPDFRLGGAALLDALASPPVRAES